MGGQPCHATVTRDCREPARPRRPGSKYPRNRAPDAQVPIPAGLARLGIAVDCTHARGFTAIQLMAEPRGIESDADRHY
jgi:hypothetical protein